MWLESLLLTVAKSFASHSPLHLGVLWGFGFSFSPGFLSSYFDSFRFGLCLIERSLRFFFLCLIFALKNPARFLFLRIFSPNFSFEAICHLKDFLFSAAFLFWSAAFFFYGMSLSAQCSKKDQESCSKWLPR